MFAASVDEIIILKWILENMIGWCAVYWVVCSVLDGVQCIGWCAVYWMVCSVFMSLWIGTIGGGCY